MSSRTMTRLARSFLAEKNNYFFDKIINTGNQDFLISSRTMIDKYLFGKYFLKKKGRE
jgi:hypothetical protein